MIAPYALHAYLRQLGRSLRRMPGQAARRLLSRNVDTRGVKTVCLALGPYRNLTTLTASLLALHPNCQVLNHAGARIFGDGRLNFLVDYGDEKFAAFLKCAIYISGGGRRGSHGGSILFSHAFDSEGLKQAYRARYGEQLVKNDIECLFWKESLKTSRLMRRNEAALQQIFERNEKLRFLMPVRNPLDCAASNLKSGYAELFENLAAGADMGAVLESVLGELLWFFELHARYPDRCFYFFENAFNEDVVLRLAEFLRLRPEKDWIQSVLANFTTRSSYEHDPEVIAVYDRFVDEHFSAFPEVARRLREFAPSSRRNGERPCRT